MAQSWMALLAGLLALVLVPISGVATGRAVTAAVYQQHAQWHRTSATVLQQPSGPVGIDTGNSAGGQVYAKVRWVTQNHVLHTGETATASDARVGDRTSVWLDRHGALVRDPGSPTDITAMGVVAGITTACGTGLLVLGAERVGVYLLDRRRYAQWDRDWRELDAQWRHHHQ
ncbi:hypothetical protein ACFVFQ_38330 [Streptomyces sp. NPDC057743]|uniref:Rv1733c family protein n=1 Tax=Streptomyces sp. NPDC057743 TaxID=3346236 RepID=UPI0036C71393